MISRFLLVAALLGPAGALAAEEKPAVPAEQAPAANPPEAQQTPESPQPQAEQTPQVHADPYVDFNKQVQEKLQALGFYSGPVNGDFGPYTQAALAQFQLSVPVPASGMLDEATIAALGVEPAAGEASASAGADQPPADAEKPAADAAQPAQPAEPVPTSAKPQ